MRPNADTPLSPLVGGQQVGEESHPVCQADKVGGEGEAYLDFPRLDGGRMEDVVT